ncbi:fimbrial protein [Pseudomonas sp. 32A]|uniref:fimbrial protein n=1 Tax=Pseudomonas sp. 32A TaxID=651185 RepID=UPI0040459107
MKRLFGAVVLLALAGITTTVKAADCRVNGGPWKRLDTGETVSLTVPVTVRLGADTTRILLDGANLECRYSLLDGHPAWRQDYWATAPSAWVPGGKFAGFGTGLRINGSDLNTPVPGGIRISVMPNNGIGVRVNVTPYILIRNNPTNPIEVERGDILGTLTLDQTNNYDSNRTRLVLQYTADNKFAISPSSCTINNNQPIEINFGNVHQRAIGTDPLSTSVRKDHTLTYRCPDPGINTPITITYKGTPSSFNANALVMSNPNVGTALVRQGTAVRVNGSFLTRITNSSGSDVVTFALVKRAGSLPVEGVVNGNGVLVMGVP